MFKQKGGGVKGLLNNVQKNCTFLKGWLPLAERWHDDKGGGVSIPPKSDDVIYEQPLYTYSSRVHMYIYIYIFILALMFDLM